GATQRRSLPRSPPSRRSSGSRRRLPTSRCSSTQWWPARTRRRARLPKPVCATPWAPSVERGRSLTSCAVSTIAELLDSAAADVESGWLPSCQLAVARDGELLAFETFGAATPATRYCIFSCTKPIVASAVWVLIGEGRLDVQCPVGSYLPE